MSQTGRSSSDHPEEEEEEEHVTSSTPAEPNAIPASTSAVSDAAGSAHISLPSVTPITPLEEAPEDEKDAQDRLTPAALVHAASGIQLHRLRNSSDLEKAQGAPEKDVEELDKVLASVPPTLERQPAVPSQPGAYRAGGAIPEEESVVSGMSGSAAAPTALIEATLVDEAAAPRVVVAPVYKGQIVEEGGDERGNENDDNVVTLPKRCVRCFIAAFCLLLIATVLAIVLVLTRDGDETTKKNNNEDVRGNPYWYHNESSSEVWNRLEGYKYVSHHMAMVSIVNPIVSTPSQGNYGNATCTPIHDDKSGFSDSSGGSNQTSNRRFLRDGRSFRNSGRDSDIMVSFTCGPASSSVTMINGRPDTMILFHDADLKATPFGNNSITCMDAKPNDEYRYNEVVCRIPSDTGDGTFPFLFSCFSQTEEMAAIASVDTHHLALQCSIAALPQNDSSISVEGVEVESSGTEDLPNKGIPPKLLVNSPAAVVLSTQRLCRLADGGNSWVAQEDLSLERRNLTDACSSNGMRLNDENFNAPLCVSRNDTMHMNATYDLSECPCPNNLATTCYGTNFTLPNITLFDPWNGSGEDANACSVRLSVRDSLVEGGDAYPSVPLKDSKTLEQLRSFFEATEGWVQGQEWIDGDAQ